jgi:protein involved in polysaccharide export with SLBB domain
MQSRLHHPGWFFRAIRAVVLMAVLLTGAAAICSAQNGSAMEGGSIPESAVSSTYELSPYDVIDVAVYNEEDLHTRTRLGSDGTALLPLIGTVSLGGLTVVEANDLIRKKYAAGFVKDPHVLLTVLDYRKSTFSILGQVMKPGIYEIPEGSHMSVVDAILLAGGFTRLASQNGVLVKRMVKGKAVVFKEKAGSMADSSDVAPFEILPGDVIKVKESWW